MSTPNPYAAPKAPVADPALAVPGSFTPDGRARPAGNGWNWIAEGWRFFMKAPVMWLVFALLGLVFMIVMAALQSIPFIGIVFSIASTLLTPILLGGLMLGCRGLDEGKELEFRHLFAGFQAPLGNLAAVGAIYLGLVIVVMLIVALVSGASMFAMMSGGHAANPALAAGAMFGSLVAILIALALLVPAAMLMWFAPALVVLHRLAPVEAMKASWRGCLKNVVPFLVYGLVLLIPAIVATVPLLLGWLVLGPVVVASVYTSYRDIYLS